MKYGQFGTEPHTTHVYMKQGQYPYLQIYLQGILHKYGVLYT